MSTITKPRRCNYCRGYTAHTKDVCPFWVHFLIILLTCGVGIVFTPCIVLWDLCKSSRCVKCGSS